MVSTEFAGACAAPLLVDRQPVDNTISAGMAQKAIIPGAMYRFEPQIFMVSPADTSSVAGS
jgi:hypothetical protein